ncbi:hypothetical protein [Brevundimonas sp. SL161]|uniref:hypothetical protein n=1 Tax=Brevundimonas sp. SL161 TaxID=2804613 RepID=UPI003CF0C0FD
MNDFQAIPIRAASQTPLLALSPLGSRLVLEISAGRASIASSFLARSPATRLVNLRLSDSEWEEVISSAAGLSCGDQQTGGLLDKADYLVEGQSPDVIILSGIETLYDPQSLLMGLRARCAPGAVCLVAAPNVAHWSVLVEQMAGRWSTARSQSIDRPVAGFFTRQSLITLLRETGWTVVDTTPIVGDQDQTEAAVEAFGTAARTLGIESATLKDELAATQWIARATNGPPAPQITIAALGMKKVAGVTDARIDHPMAAMASRVSIRAAWGAGGVEIPGHWPPGVLILHRQFLDSSAFVDTLEKRIAKGWIVVSEIDDDPAHWPAYAAAGHRAFRGVHAVTVSTEALAEVVRQWNPTVAVLPNAVPYLPEASQTSPKSGGRLRLFFGALNRVSDWQPILSAITSIGAVFRDQLEFVVVHDRAFFDALGDVPKSFTPTLDYDAYLASLASCDIALLPLTDTRFNRLKSDIKLIECAAAGVVPICSPIIYGEDSAHGEIALFAVTPQDWAASLSHLITDRDALRKRRAAGLEYVTARRMQVHQIDQREGVFRQWLDNAAVLEEARHQRLASSPDI